MWKYFQEQEQRVVRMSYSEGTNRISSMMVALIILWKLEINHFMHLVYGFEITPNSATDTSAGSMLDFGGRNKRLGANG